MLSGIYFSLLIYLPTCFRLRFSWNCRRAVLFIVDAEQTKERKIHIGHCKSFGDYCPCRRNTVNTCLTYNTVTASARFYWQQWWPTLLSGYLAHSLPLSLTSSLSLPPSLPRCTFAASQISRIRQFRAGRCGVLIRTMRLTRKAKAGFADRPAIESWDSHRTEQNIVIVELCS